MKFLKQIILTILIIPIFSVAAQTNYVLEMETGKIHVMTMANNFTVFVKEDSSSAMIHAEYLCKAGYSSQTPSTAGFFPLYARLFSTTKNENGSTPFSDVALTSSCNSDSSTYTADVTFDQLENLLKEIAHCAKSPSFQEKNINEQYSILKKESQEYASSATGFINATIDSKIYGEAPWKTQSGIYPALFSSYTASEIRTFLNDIAKRWYTPDNSALFITGNISAKRAYNLAVKYFGQWTGSSNLDRTSDAFKKNQVPSNKKFVLVDREFSSELTQIAVQFTGLSTPQADILNASFNSVLSPYKTLAIEKPELSIRSREYLASASVQRGNSSRLILQALMEEPYSFASANEPGPQKKVTPADQAEIFLRTVKKSAELSHGNFLMAQNTVAANYKKKIGNSVGSMQLVADWWAMDSTLKDENYYQRFLTLPSSAEAVTEKDLSDSIQNEDPYIFVLVNTAVYNSNKDSFEKNGYQLLTKDTGSWYHNQIAVAQALENEKNAKNKKQAIELSGLDVEDLSPASNFYYQNSLQFEEDILENGIPLLVKNVPNSQTIAISLSIAGGEASSPKNQKLLRTVLVNAYAKNLQDTFTFMKSSGQIAGDTSIRARTEQTVSYLTVECVKTDFLSVMTAMLNALVYGDISAANADRLVNEQAAQWNSKMMLLDTQMEYDTFRYLYRNTPYSEIYNQEAKVLADTTIDTITLAYTEFLDASLYSFVFVGDIDISTAKKYADQSFGILREQTQRQNTYDTIPSPSFKNTARKVRLHHLYTSTLTKEQAGTGVPILIPTTDFYDPVQFYFMAPEEPNEINLYNCLLNELKDRTQKYLPENTTCSVLQTTNFLKLGGMRVNGILHTNSFSSAYKKARQELLNELEIPGGNLVNHLKQLWVTKNLLQTQTNLGTAELIQRGMEINRKYLYLEDYLSMELADRLDFLEVLQKYFPENPPLVVTSVDSKN